jgi:hypothetical protein
MKQRREKCMRILQEEVTAGRAIRGAGDYETRVRNIDSSMLYCRENVHFIKISVAKVIGVLVAPSLCADLAKHKPWQPCDNFFADTDKRS